ncbi:alpha-L-glutamate ligase [Pseudanabaena biceps]|nr:alpha-L-glutamate ligase [Pseudanabaena biceps]
MLTNIKVLLEACQNLELKHEILHPNQNLVKVEINNLDYYFTNYSTPLIPQAIAEIFKDKQYFYQVFQDVAKMPRTISYISPYCDEKYREYLQFTTVIEIVEQIKNNFELPIIVKRNRGSGGNNVFKCVDAFQVQQALENIFNVNLKSYDYIALAQEPINIIKEYRCVYVDRHLEVLYEKDISQAKFTGNLSPLHWEGAIAMAVSDQQIRQAIDQFVQPIFQKMSIAYVGLDVAVDDRGVYWMIEANSHPNFDIFIRDNGKDAIVQLFQKILNYLMQCGS